MLVSYAFGALLLFQSEMEVNRKAWCSGFLGETTFLPSIMGGSTFSSSSWRVGAVAPRISSSLPASEMLSVLADELSKPFVASALRRRSAAARLNWAISDSSAVPLRTNHRSVLEPETGA